MRVEATIECPKCKRIFVEPVMYSHFETTCPDCLKPLTVILNVEVTVEQIFEVAE